MTNDLLLKTARPKTSSWLKQASKGNARCAKCKTQYLKGELNAQKHCRHCADELGEAHLLNTAFAPITSIVPLLDLYPEVDPGDHLPALLEDPIEYIEADDIVLWDVPGCAEAREGVVIVTMPELKYCIVKFKYGAQRSCHIDEITLVLKASAREIETPTPMGMSAL